VVYREGEEWIAHCLQMDIVASGKSAKVVEDDIIALIKAQVRFAIDNDNMENVFKPAPSAIWSMIGHAKRRSMPTVDEIIAKIKSKGGREITEEDKKTDWYKFASKKPSCFKSPGIKAKK